MDSLSKHRKKCNGGLKKRTVCTECNVEFVTAKGQESDVLVLLQYFQKEKTGKINPKTSKEVISCPKEA